MAKIYYGVLNKGEASSSSSSTPCKQSSSATTRRRTMEIRRIKFVDATQPEPEINGRKRQKLQLYTASCPLDCEIVEDNYNIKGTLMKSHSSPPLLIPPRLCPKFGLASVCGRRRNMEDTVAIHPSFLRQGLESSAAGFHYFGVYDGHGCSHVATRCRERLHELVKEELLNREDEWKGAMERSFTRMDKEVIKLNESMIGSNCRCELQSPECDAVGSTAVVAIVTSDKIIVANCGDSRAVLCRKGKAVPLSSDHKPDRPDEQDRIEEAGGRVIYWDGARVLGVLAMSRSIGDNYLKPYVTCEPEVTVTDRTADDECLIIASDGLWNVVSNEMACKVARMCLRGKVDVQAPPWLVAEMEGEAVVGSTLGGEMGEISDKACSDASILLTKLALGRNSTDNVSVVVVDLRRGHVGGIRSLKKKNVLINKSFPHRNKN